MADTDAGLGEGTATEISYEMNFKNAPHIILISIIFVCQYLSKRRDTLKKMDEEERKKADKIFWKYMILFQLAKSADWCLGPFVHEFFTEYHGLNIEAIAKMTSISFLTNLFIGPSLIGYLNDQNNKKIPCMMYGIALSISCVVRLMRHNVLALIFSQIFFGIASSLLYSSFENWFFSEVRTQLTDEDVREYAFTTSFEKSMIVDAITAVVISMCAGQLKKSYGVKAPFVMSVGLAIINFIMVIFLINPHKDKDALETPNKELYNVSDVFSNTVRSLKLLAENPFYIIIGLTESMFFILLHTFIFSWVPNVKELNANADTSYLFMIMMMSLMAGGAIFKIAYNYFDDNSFAVAKLTSFFAILGFWFISFGGSYQTTYIGYIFYEISVGLFYPAYSKIKSEYLPAKCTGSLMTIFKVPFNLVVVILLITTNKMLTIQGFMKLNLLIAIVALIFQITFFTNEKRILKKVEDASTKSVIAESKKQKKS